jgi:hypothetical protein
MADSEASAGSTAGAVTGAGREAPLVGVSGRSAARAGPDCARGAAADGSPVFDPASPRSVSASSARAEPRSAGSARSASAARSRVDRGASRRSGAARSRAARSTARSKRSLDSSAEEEQVDRPVPGGRPIASKERRLEQCSIERPTEHCGCQAPLAPPAGPRGPS